MTSLFLNLVGMVFTLSSLVEQTASPRLDANGRKWHGGYIEKKIREKIWRVEDLCPVIDTPSRLYVIDNIDESFEEAVDNLDKSKKVDPYVTTS